MGIKMKSGKLFFNINIDASILVKKIREMEENLFIFSNDFEELESILNISRISSSFDLEE